MNTSQSIAIIAPALVKAQKNIGAAPKDAKNPFFSSTYADLGSVMAVCKEPLLAQGISILQPLITRDNGDIVLETILLHESGEFIGSSMKITPPRRMVVPKGEKFDPYLAPDPQAEGSAITYARRYALQAMVFIPSVDDDAEWAERALRNRPLPAETVEKIETKIEALVEQGGTEAHKEAMALDKGLQRRTPEAKAIATYEEEHPEHKNKVACATQDEKGNWTFTLIGGAKTPAKKTKAVPAAPIEPSAPQDWKSVICHLGDEGGKMNGKTLGEIFGSAKTEKMMLGLVKWFESAIAATEHPNNAALAKAVEKAKSEWAPPIPTDTTKTTASASTPAPTTEPAPKAAETPQPTAGAQGWRGYVIASKSPDWHGKKLGDLQPSEIKTLNDDYISKIDPARATLQQKSLIANVALAMRELNPTAELPPAAKVEGTEQHTAKLVAALNSAEWDPAVFLTVCKLNGWVEETHRTIADVTAAELDQLSDEWETVKVEMAKATAPAEQP